MPNIATPLMEERRIEAEAAEYFEQELADTLAEIDMNESYERSFFRKAERLQIVGDSAGVKAQRDLIHLCQIALRRLQLEVCILRGSLA